jgi:VanZ family protein
MMRKEAKTARGATLNRNHNRFLGAQWVARTLTWLSALSIVVLSLVPPSLRPITEMSHNREHFAIFVLWGMAFGLGYNINLAYQLGCAVLFAGAVEFAQYWVPGRHARISDLIVDAEAACVGVLCARIFLGWLTIWLHRRRQQSTVRKGLPQRTNRDLSEETAMKD